jgi:hypothetical protein
MPSWTLLEKYSLTVLAAIALLMFFFPLIVIRAPIVGEQDVSGYDVFSKIREFGKQIKKNSEPTEKPEHPSNRTTPPASEPAIPLSLRLAWLIPVNIILALLLSAIVLIGTRLNKNIATFSAYIGTAFSVLSILHVLALNSDFHSWMTASMKSSAAELANNPFAALADRFGSLMVNAFKISPGTGLYVLAVCLGFAALIAKSRILATLRIVDPIPRVQP